MNTNILLWLKKMRIFILIKNRELRMKLKEVKEMMALKDQTNKTINIELETKAKDLEEIHKYLLIALEKKDFRFKLKILGFILLNSLFSSSKLVDDLEIRKIREEMKNFLIKAEKERADLKLLSDKKLDEIKEIYDQVTKFKSLFNLN